MQPFTLTILAGGNSSRMGTDKALVNILGQTMIERILTRAKTMEWATIHIITNRPQDYTHLGLSLYRDVVLGKGSLGGIYSALHYSPTAYTFVLACDMPFINPALIRYMQNLCANDPYDVVVPRVQGHPQGLHAIYKQTCLPAIRRKLDANRLKVIGFFDEMRVHYLDEAEYTPFTPGGEAFRNINTPEELAEAQQLASMDRERFHAQPYRASPYTKGH